MNSHVNTHRKYHWKLTTLCVMLNPQYIVAYYCETLALLFLSCFSSYLHPFLTMITLPTAVIMLLCPYDPMCPVYLGFVFQ